MYLATQETLAATPNLNFPGMFCFLPLYYQHNSGDATVPEPAETVRPEARARARANEESPEQLT